MNKEKKLLEEAAGLLGMVAEVKAKCQLLKNKCKFAEKQIRQEGRRNGIIYKRKEDVPVPQELLVHTVESVGKMNIELSKYSDRLEEIWLELKDVRDGKNEFSGLVDSGEKEEPKAGLQPR